MGPHLCIVAAIIAALGLGSTLAAQNYDIELRSGESIYGSVTAQDDKFVTVERSFWRRRTGVIVINTTYSRRDIVAMHEVLSLEDDFHQHAAACLTTYDAKYTLVRWCLDRNLISDALEIARQLYQEDVTDPVTLELIDETGYVIDQGTWLTTADYAARHHLVEYAGVLMSPSEAHARNDFNIASRATSDTQSRLASAQNESKALLLILRDATVAMKRAERHQAEARDLERKQHLAGLTADQIADEQEAARFDAEYGIAEAAEPDSKELLDARKDFATASARYQQVIDDIAGMKARITLLASAMAEDASSIAQITGKPFPPAIAQGGSAATAPAGSFVTPAPAAQARGAASAP